MRTTTSSSNSSGSTTTTSLSMVGEVAGSEGIHVIH